MSRNLYLGADLGPAIEAKGLGEFTAATGKVLRDVTANDFPTRAKGLAQEIIKKNPDLVGLQEVSLWRTGPPSTEPLLGGRPANATTVRYDYLQLLLAQLNKGKKRYKVAVSNDEFDFEAPGDENGVPGDGPNSLIKDAEINGRLTMRDVILARVGKDVEDQQAQDRALRHPPGRETPGGRNPGHQGLGLGRRPGRETARSSTSSTPISRPSTRPRKCRASAPGRRPSCSPGPAERATCRTILVGDLNSDDDTVESGDQQAYRNAARRRDARAQHQQTARLLPQIEPAGRNRRAATSPISTTRSTT